MARHMLRRQALRLRQQRGQIILIRAEQGIEQQKYRRIRTQRTAGEAVQACKQAVQRFIRRDKRGKPLR